MYFKDLTKKEKLHLRKQGITTLQKFKEVAAEQARMRGEGGEPCFDCKNIARKLDLPVDLSPADES